MRIWHLFSALLPLSPARLSSTATLSPRAAQSRATARPMPSAPPVTTIVRAVFDCGVIRRAPQGLFLDFESRDGQNPARVPTAHPPSSTLRRCTCNTFLFIARRFLLSISERQQDRLLHARKQMPKSARRRRQRGPKKWLILRLPLKLSA